MFAIGRLFNILERGTASYDRIMLLLGEKNHWVQPKLEEHSDVEGELAFDIKEFKYPDQKDRGVNLIAMTVRSRLAVMIFAIIKCRIF